VKDVVGVLKSFQEEKALACETFGTHLPNIERLVVRVLIRLSVEAVVAMEGGMVAVGGVGVAGRVVAMDVGTVIRLAAGALVGAGRVAVALAAPVEANQPWGREG
jgi:hypothetical protein